MQVTADRILAVLQTAEQPLPLQGIAESVDRSPSATLRRLQELVEEGRVERSGDRKRARYRLQENARVDAAWNQDGRWLRAAWTADGVDWMFPLAGRVQLRRRTERLLRRAFQNDLLKDITVVVFGSAARHDARHDSDLDVLVLGRTRRAAWQDLVVAMELDGEGVVQVEVAKRLQEINTNLRRAVVAEGVTVFSSTSPPWFVETERVDPGDG